MRRHATPVIGAALAGVSFWVLARALDRTGFDTLRMSLAAMPADAVAIAIAITAVNYLVLTWHDQLAFVYAGVRLARGRIALASLVGYAISNNVGFALLSGTSARYRFYSRWGIGPADVSRIVLFYSATFWLGLLIVGGASALVAEPQGLTTLVPRAVAAAAGAGALLLVAAYAALCVWRPGPIRIRRATCTVPGPRLMALQVALSTLEWLLAAAPLYVLLPSPRPPFLVVAGAFAAAQLAGLVSHVPGGLGVFEGVMVLFLSPPVSGARLVPALVVYRMVYYLLPLAVALVTLLVDETWLRRRQLARWSTGCRTLAAWAAPRILALFTFASGALLLYSGATPGVPWRVAWLAPIMPLPLLELSHFTASLTGLGLLLLAQAIALRVDAAFYLTAVALGVGSTASLLKGADYEEAAVLAAVLAALLAARRHFTRRARVFAEPISRGWLAASATVVASSVVLGLFAYKHVDYTNDLWWRVAADADAPRFLRASVAVTLVALVVGVRQLLRPVAPCARLTAADIPDVERVIAGQSSTTPQLVFLGDKSILWNHDRTAFLMYAVRGRSCVALADPVGPRSEARPLVDQFLSMCDRFGSTPVFYEASAERLADFADVGLVSIKIGEEARVPLAQFTLSGSGRKALRTSVNRMIREGFTFRIVEPPEVQRLLPELQDVSDEWLATKSASEKGFSVGFFDEDYLRRSPVAVMERGGRIEAFTNLWRAADRREISPDLMRYRATAPPGVMDALFAHAMEWAAERGYAWFNLGMAPLAGLPVQAASRAWLRAGHFVYRHGESFYNFQGVRAYKSKFDPVWQPRYLAYPGGLALARVVTDVASLIAGGYVRMFLRGGRRAA